MTREAVWAVVPAAGRGRRMGADMPKQYLPLAGRPVIEHTLEVLLAHPRVDGVVVAVAADDPEWFRVAGRLGARFAKPLQTVEGGAERAYSVLHGLHHLSGRLRERDWVLVHDAARPCLHPDDLSRLITVSRDGPVGGILAVPVSDTLKRADAEQHVAETVDRRHLWRALTPQMFRLDLLLAALDAALRAGLEVTDEAAAMERAGHPVRLVEGRPDNVKITTRSDLELAERLLQSGLRAS